MSVSTYFEISEKSPNFKQSYGLFLLSIQPLNTAIIWLQKTFLPDLDTHTAGKGLLISLQYYPYSH